MPFHESQIFKNALSQLVFAVKANYFSIASYGRFLTRSPRMQGRLSLGFELSTQSAKSVVLDLKTGQVVFTGKVDFDSAFPSYGTKGGVLPSSSPEIRHASPFLMIEVMDRIFQDLLKGGVRLAEIAAVKADAMQHCTVYANGSLAGTLANLADGPDLLSGLKGAISRKSSPIWEDRSTADEADVLTGLLSRKGGLVKRCANKAELRFPGPQIMKWAAENPAEYGDTDHILLLSAFVTSVLAGRIAPVDTGDGWGTNLNSSNIRSPGWDGAILSAVNGWLKARGLGPLDPKLGKMTHYDSPAGTISPYFVRKYGLTPGTVVLAGTGDNPATLLGCGGGAVLSLGSSYTVNGVMKRIPVSACGEFNVFGYTRGTVMALSCLTNGGKLHEEFLRKYAVKSGAGVLRQEHWDSYARLAGSPVLSPDERLMLPYLMPESVPVRPAGIVRDGFREDDAVANVRGLYVSQALSLRLHSCHLGRVPEICVVGGGARDRIFRQMLTDLFEAPTYVIRNADLAAPLGCAIAAGRHALKISYAEAAKRFVQKDPASVMTPSGADRKVLAGLLARYAELEKKNI
jgi:xylulokinase